MHYVCILIISQNIISVLRDLPLILQCSFVSAKTSYTGVKDQVENLISLPLSGALLWFDTRGCPKFLCVVFIVVPAHSWVKWQWSDSSLKSRETRGGSSFRITPVGSIAPAQQLADVFLGHGS